MGFLHDLWHGKPDPDVTIVYIALVGKDNYSIPKTVMRICPDLATAEAWGKANLPMFPRTWGVFSNTARESLQKARLRDQLDINHQVLKEQLALRRQNDAVDAMHKREADLKAAQALWAKTGDTRVQGVPEYKFNDGGWEWVYAFTFPSHITAAKHEGKAPLVKIGTSTNHYKNRVAEQTRGSGFAEAPIIVMAVRCADGKALERHMHIELDEHHSREGSGTEWFRVTPAQILNAMGSRVSAV